MHTIQINHNPIFHLYYHNPNKSITNIETDNSTNNTKIKIKDGIYEALNAYNNNILNLTDVEYQTYSKYVNDYATNNNVISTNDILVLKEYDQDNDLVKYEEQK